MGPGELGESGVKLFSASLGQGLAGCLGCDRSRHGQRGRWHPGLLLTAQLRP
jgi:hypothetical protein